MAGRPEGPWQDAVLVNAQRADRFIRAHRVACQHRDDRARVGTKVSPSWPTGCRHRCVRIPHHYACAFCLTPHHASTALWQQQQRQVCPRLQARRGMSGDSPLEAATAQPSGARYARALRSLRCDALSSNRIIFCGLATADPERKGGDRRLLLTAAQLDYFDGTGGGRLAAARGRGRWAQRRCAPSVAPSSALSVKARRCRRSVCGT